MRVPHISDEPVAVPFRAVGSTPVEVTGASMALRLAEAGPPASDGDWTTAAYVDGAVVVGLDRLARGLPPGDYRLWVRLQVDGAAPVRVFPMTLTG